MAKRIPKALQIEPGDIPFDPRRAENASVYEVTQLLTYARESANREMEALRLYEPLPFQDAFHRCTTKEVMLQKGNQAGGSIAGFVEDARACLGMDPYDKYPKRDGVLVCLGYGEKHIGRVIHRYLFRQGAFRIIRDLKTNRWRVYRPWPEAEGGDYEREKESQPAPPLIPARYLASPIAWVKKREHIFSVAHLTTGWTIYAANSEGDPGHAQGFQVDLYHIDEDVAQAGWYDEAVARTSIRRGKLRWTALPHGDTDDIVKMIDRGEDINQTDTTLITATMYDNPYFPKESRDANERIYLSQGRDVYEQRILGKLNVGQRLMYPTFSEHIHNAHKPLSDDELEREKNGEPLRFKIQRVLTERGGQPPWTWTRYAYVDPGHSVCAVLFVTVPPPEEFGHFIVAYDELYIRNCTASLFGHQFAMKVQDLVFQRFVIDAHGGALREIGSGVTPRRQYEKELEQRNIASEQTRYRFKDGCDDVSGRENLLRELLTIRRDGSPRLLIYSPNCFELVREMKQFKRLITKIGGRVVPQDKGNRRMDCHAVECLEYCAADQPEYVKVKKKSRKESFYDRVMRQRKERKEAQLAMSGAFGPSHISLGPTGVNS